MTRRRRIPFLFLCILSTFLFFWPAPPPAQAAPQLHLPTPVGETWSILQGFYCGTHVGTQSRSLDLVNLSGVTRGAPVRAAATGTTFVWQGSTGTLILSHGGGYYTMYTHMQNPITTRSGLRVRQGQVIGQVGSAGTTVPHLHFLFFYAPDRGAYQRTPLELDFADGYSFHDTAGCSQHIGETVVARENPDETPPTIAFETDVQPDTWYCEDKRIAFHVDDDQWVRGFSQSFDQAPPDNTPTFEAEDGYMQLSWAGEGIHTFYVQAWDASGHQTLVPFGPIGYDTTAPTFQIPDSLPRQTYQLDAANQSVSLSWPSASDGDGSGIAGYHVYLGTDPNGTSDQVSDDATTVVNGVTPGCYLLRVQAFDRACGTSEWTTLQEVLVTDQAGQSSSSVCASNNQPASTDKSTPASTSEPLTTPTPEPTEQSAQPVKTPVPPILPAVASPTPTVTATATEAALGAPEEKSATTTPEKPSGSWPSFP